MPDYKKPKTATDIDGQEIIRRSTSQGDVIVVDGIPQVLLGFQKGGFGSLDYGFKISQQGIDVLTAEDSELVMSSAFNSFKIASTGILSKTLPASPNGVYESSAAHGLSTIPTVLGYLRDGSGGYWNMPFSTLDLGSPNIVRAFFYCKTDATNVTFGINTNYSFFGTTTFTMKYFLMQESLPSY